LAQPELRSLTIELKGNEPPGIGPALFRPNARGSIANITITVDASSFSLAEQTAYNIVAPIVSWLSYKHDVGIEFHGWIVHETATGAFRIRAGVSGAGQHTTASEFMSKREYRTVLSAYREGLNAMNVFYQVLCFYKVIEGVLTIRSGRKRREGIAFREPANERIPTGRSELGAETDEEGDSFDPYLGKSFGAVREKLRPVIRNAVAHLNPLGDEAPSGGERRPRDRANRQLSLVADVFHDLMLCETTLPVVKFMARIMLDNELRADPEVAQFL
jgi:hypothetical protein